MTDWPGLNRPLRKGDIDHHRDHGVVHLLGLLEPDWIVEAKRVFDIVIELIGPVVHRNDKE